MKSANRRLILVVEDDEAILRSVEQILTDEGYAVAVALNGREALEQVLRATPRLILLDMKMPVMDGWTFATAYRQLPGPHAPIIALTAAHDSRARAAEIAAAGYIAKPFDVEKLLDLVRRYVSPA
ncbi:MAG TPA: response regulator [Ktedonobacterales bacterium]